MVQMPVFSDSVEDLIERFRRSFSIGVTAHSCLFPLTVSETTAGRLSDQQCWVPNLHRTAVLVLRSSNVGVWAKQEKGFIIQPDTSETFIFLYLLYLGERGGIGKALKSTLAQPSKNRVCKANASPAKSHSWFLAVKHPNFCSKSGKRTWWHQGCFYYLK